MKQVDTGPTAGRLEALSDGLYAIAMTLLVLNLDIPADIYNNHELLVDEICSRWPLFTHYFLGFIILGSFWIIQHMQFYYIKRINRTSLWINIINLMFVALVPFTTSLIADYNEMMIAADIFHLNLFLIGATFWCNWSYAIHKRHLTEERVSEKIIKRGLERYMIIPVVAVIGILISFISPRWSTLPYLFIPFISAREGITRIKAKGKGRRVKGKE